MEPLRGQRRFQRPDIRIQQSRGKESGLSVFDPNFSNASLSGQMSVDAHSPAGVDHPRANTAERIEKQAMGS